jgi:hypothetical protein
MFLLQINILILRYMNRYTYIFFSRRIFALVIELTEFYNCPSFLDCIFCAYVVSLFYFARVYFTNVIWNFVLLRK